MAPSSTSKQKLCKLAGVLYLVQYSAGFTSVVPNQTPSGNGISKGTTAVRVEGGVTLWASEEGSDGSSSAQQASGYAARRRNTKLTYGGKRQKKQPKAIRFKDIESLEELQELETQMQQETTEQVELVQKVQPEQVELEPEQVEPEPEQVEPELEQPSFLESLSSQGSDDLMQVIMGGQSMFLPVAQAEGLIAAGAAERVGAAPEPEQVEPEPEQVEPELEQPSLSESLSSQGSDDLMQVTMGGQSMFLPVARAEILIAAGAAERVSPAPGPAPAPVSAEPEPALVQVKMGGNTMYLEADQAEALLASGAATRVGPAPAPALDFDNPTDDPWYGRVVIFEQLDDDLNPVPNAPALAGVPLPQPKAAAAAPTPAAAADPDALVRVLLGGQPLFVPAAQAKALLAAGAAQPLDGDAAAAAPAAAAPVGGRDRRRRTSAAAVVQAAAAAVEAPADPDALVRVKMGGQMLYVPYAQAQALLASGAAEPVEGNKVPVRGGEGEEPRKGFRQRVKSLFKKDD